MKNNNVNFNTTYSYKHLEGRNVLKKYWFLLNKDPYVSTSMTRNPKIIYKRSPSLKNVIAPSLIKQHGEKVDENGKSKGSYRCEK